MARRARSILAGIKGVAPASAGRGRRRGLLHDRRGSCDLRLIAPLRLAIAWLRLAIARLSLRRSIRCIGLRRRIGGNAGLGDRRLAASYGRRAAELPQALFQLTVAVLQLLVLAGQLPQLVLQPLDPHLHIRIIGLGESLR